MWRYWVDFYIFPPLAVGLAVYDCRSSLWVLMCITGFALWTFAEYWVHRSLLHRWFWHGTHERHHDHPSEFVTNIWWYTPILFFVAFFVMPISLYVGFSLGYIWFLTMHHWLHHIELKGRTWLHSYAIWHNRHHKLTDCNYGITTPVWDILFRTSR